MGSNQRSQNNYKLRAREEKVRMKGEVRRRRKKGRKKQGVERASA